MKDTKKIEKIKRTLQNSSKFSARSLKERNPAVSEVADSENLIIQTSLKKESFEDSLKRVEDIASLLEDGDLPLQERVENFEQGMKLLKQCENELKEVELSIRKVMDKAEGVELEEIE